MCTVVAEKGGNKWWKMGEILRLREKKMPLDVRIGLNFYRIPSSKTPFKAKRRRLRLQAFKRTDWTDGTCDYYPTIKA